MNSLAGYLDCFKNIRTSGTLLRNRQLLVAQPLLESETQTPTWRRGVSVSVWKQNSLLKTSQRGNGNSPFWEGNVRKSRKCSTCFFSLLYKLRLSFSPLKAAQIMVCLETGDSFPQGFSSQVWVSVCVWESGGEGALQYGFKCAYMHQRVACNSVYQCVYTHVSVCRSVCARMCSAIGFSGGSNPRVLKPNAL